MYEVQTPTYQVWFPLSTTGIELRSPSLMVRPSCLQASCRPSSCLVNSEDRVSVAIGSRGESNHEAINNKAERGNYFWVPWLLMSGTMPMAVPRPSVVFCIYRRSGLPVFCQYICSKGTNERLLYYMRKDLSVELFLHVCSTIDKRGQRGLYRWERWMGWGWAGGESQGPYSSAFSVLDKRAYVSVVSFRTYQLPEYWIDLTLVFSPKLSVLTYFI